MSSDGMEVSSDKVSFALQCFCFWKSNLASLVSKNHAYRALLAGLQYVNKNVCKLYFGN